MKRFLLMLAVMAGVAVGASARDTYAHSDAVLPEAARTTINNNFKAKVSVVKIDKTMGRVSDYEVVLTDGTEITFDRNGNWDNIETANTSSVPRAFVPQAISDYVAKNQPGARIVGLDRERSGYEVELSNGVDIKFDRQGQFQRYD